jgi:O-antigen/teichoic acid export membrane protein
VTGSLASRTGSALLWNGMGLVVTRLISLVRFVILARLLAPEDFGLLAIAWVAIELLLTATDVGMVTALVQRDQVDAAQYDTAWTVGLVRALVVAGAVVAGAPLIAQLFGEPRAADILPALGLAPVLTALSSIKIADLTRNLQFRKLAMIRVPEAATEAAVSIALAPRLGIWALVAGVLAANVVRVGLSYLLAPHRPRISFDQGAARSLFRFGRWLFAVGVLGLAGEALLRAVIARRLGTAELGVFYLAMRLVMLPLTSIEGAVASVGMPLHARLQSDPVRRTRALRTSLVGMLAVLVPGYVVLIVVAPALVHDLLGAHWAGAELPIRVLAAGAAIRTIAAACEPMVVGLGRPQVAAALAAIRMVLVASLGWVLAGAAGLVGATVAWLITEAVVAVGWGLVTAGMVVRPISGLGRQLLAVLAAAAAAGLTALGLGRLLPDLPATIVVAASLALAVAGGVLWLLDRRLDTGLGRELAGMFPSVAARLARARGGRP